MFLYFKTNSGRKFRGAFTLVELLVVIAIIGILVALLLPAVQQARAAARRMQCSNKERQLALAVLNFESANSRGPSSDSYLDSTGGSWILQVLPFLEEAAIADQVSAVELGRFGAQQGVNQPALREIAATPLSILACPDDPGGSLSRNGISLADGIISRHWQWRRSVTDVAVTNYKGCIGSFPISNSSQFDSDPIFGEADWRFSNKSNGVLGFKGRDSKIFKTIRDGRSKTYMIGEDVPLHNYHSIWIFANGDYCSTNPPLNFLPPEPMPNRWQDVMGFRSLHTSGANFAFCDGSVHFVSDGIDSYVYRAMSSRNGGEIVTDN